MPEEREDHQNALNGARYRAILSNLDLWLRNLKKYEDKELLTIEEVREKIIELSNDYELKV